MTAFIQQKKHLTTTEQLHADDWTCGRCFGALCTKCGWCHDCDDRSC